MCSPSSNDPNAFYPAFRSADMNVVEVLVETIEGYLSGGTDEALAEGVEETAEEATGEDL